MKRITGYLLATCVALPVGAQTTLTLDSCRALALSNNKQLAVAHVKQDIAANMRKSARTKYLPRVSALAGYEYTSREISLLSDDQKKTLGNMGTNATAGIGGKATSCCRLYHKVYGNNLDSWDSLLRESNNNLLQV